MAVQGQGYVSSPAKEAENSWWDVSSCFGTNHISFVKYSKSLSNSKSSRAAACSTVHVFNPVFKHILGHWKPAYNPMRRGIFMTASHLWKKSLESPLFLHFGNTTCWVLPCYMLGIGWGWCGGGRINTWTNAFLLPLSFSSICLIHPWDTFNLICQRLKDFWGRTPLFIPHADVLPQWLLVTARSWTILTVCIAQFGISMVLPYNFVHLQSICHMRS